MLSQMCHWPPHLRILKVLATIGAAAALLSAIPFSWAAAVTFTNAAVAKKTGDTRAIFINRSILTIFMIAILDFHYHGIL